MAGGDPFELVKKFAAMSNDDTQRNKVTLEDYFPDEGAERQPYVGVGPRPTPPPPPPPRAATTHRHGGSGLVPFGGRQISAGLVDYANQLSRLGLRFTSGYRDPHHNKKVGGVRNSYHTRTGNSGALDFVGTAKQMQEGAALARRLGAREVLIHNAGSGMHLHVGW